MDTYILAGKAWVLGLIGEWAWLLAAKPGWLATASAMIPVFLFLTFSFSQKIQSSRLHSSLLGSVLSLKFLFLFGITENAKQQELIYRSLIDFTWNETENEMKKKVTSVTRVCALRISNNSRRLPPSHKLPLKNRHKEKAKLSHQIFNNKLRKSPR